MTTIDPPPPPRPTPPDLPPPPPEGLESGPGTPPPPLEPQPALPDRNEKPAITRPELALLAVAAVLGNIALRTGFSDVGTMLAGLMVIGALFVSRRIETRSSVQLIVAAVALVPWLAIRTAPGLTAATFLTVVALVLIAAGLSREGRLFDLRLLDAFWHMFAQAFEWLYGLSMVQRLAAATEGSDRWRSIARGAVLALPVLVVFAVLLASADKVFADVLNVGNSGSLVGHLVVSTIILVPLLGVLSRAAHRTPPPEVDTPRIIGSTEVLIILGSVLALFAAFVGTQVAVAAGGADHILETEGLTRAEHARQGFFQLLWVAGLALTMLGTIRAWRRLDDDRPDRFRFLALAILALTVVIVGISIQRLLLYVDAFGLTPLRLWALVVAGWLGLALMAYAGAVGTSRAGDRNWYPGFMLISVAFVVFGLNTINPDALVARYNLTNPPAEGSIDLREIAQLSEDAVPTTIDHLDELDDGDATRLIDLLCQREDHVLSYGFLGANRSELRADEALDELCEVRVDAEAGFALEPPTGR